MNYPHIGDRQILVRTEVYLQQQPLVGESKSITLLPNSLFSKFYRSYVEDIFDARKRIFKVTAHLPNSVLVNYELNDRFQIGDKVFTINSINTNLKTGKSQLELLNVL